MCELIDGVLVEKAVSWFSSSIGAEIIILLGEYLKANPGPDGKRVGFVAGEQGFVRLPVGVPGRIRARAPDVQFVRRDRFPDGRVPRTGYPTLAPDLVVEVLSPRNTAGGDRAEAPPALRRRHHPGVGRRPARRNRRNVRRRGRTRFPVPAGGALDAAPALPGFVIDLRALLAAADG